MRERNGIEYGNLIWEMKHIYSVVLDSAVFCMLVVPVAISSCATGPAKPVGQEYVQLLPGYHHVHVMLADSLGAVDMDIPDVFDTSYKWIHHGDCGPGCEKVKYRFQSRHTKVVKEDGWIWKGEEPLEMDRMTIIHSGWTEFKDAPDDQVMQYWHNSELNGMDMDPGTFHPVCDTLVRIGDRLFSVAERYGEDYLRGRQVQTVSAMTTIRRNEIRFVFEHYARKGEPKLEGLFDSSMNVIRSIRFSNGR